MHLPAELCKMQRKKRETDGFSKNILMPRPVRIRLQGSDPGTVCQSFFGHKKRRIVQNDAADWNIATL